MGSFWQFEIVTLQYCISQLQCDNSFRGTLKVFNTFLLALAAGDGICLTRMSTNPLKPPKNLGQINLSSG